jgi:hypothetical protein
MAALYHGEGYEKAYVDKHKAPAKKKRRNEMP